MNRRIFVLIDFNKSDILIDFVNKYFDLDEFEVVLIHKLRVVSPVLANAETFDELDLEALRSAKIKIKKLLGKLQTTKNVSYEVVFEPTLYVINVLYKADKNDVIVLGNKQLGFFRNFFVGSHTSKITNNSNSMVFFVPLNKNLIFSDRNLIIVNPIKSIPAKTLAKYIKGLGVEDYFAQLDHEKRAETLNTYAIEVQKLLKNRRQSQILKLMEKTLPGYLEKLDDRKPPVILLQKNTRGFFQLLFRQDLIMNILSRKSLVIGVFPQ